MGRVKIATVFFFIMINCFSQVDSLDFYSEKFIDNLESQDTIKSIYFGEKIYKNLKNKSELNSIDGISIINFLAMINENDYEKSSKYYEELLSHMPKLFSTESNEYLGTLFKYSLLNKRNKNFEKSIKFFQKIDSVLIKNQNDIEFLVTNKYEYANTLYLNQDSKNSKIQYELLLKIMLENNPEDRRLKNIYEGLGLVYLDLNEFDKSIEYFNKSIELTMKDSTEQTLKESLRIKGLIANVYYFQNDLIKSINILKSIAESYNKNNYEVDSLYLSVLDRLGNSYADIGKYDDAVKILENLLKSKEQFYKQKNLEYALTLNNLGALNEKLENFKRAYEYYLEAYKIIKTIEIPLSDEIIAINRNLLRFINANSYRKNQFKLVDLDLNKEYIDLINQYKGVDIESNQYILLLNDFSVYLINNNEIVKAKEFLEIAEKLNAKNPYGLVLEDILISNKCYFQKLDGELENASKCYLSISTEKSNIKGLVLSNLISIYLELEKTNELKEILTQYLEFEKNTLEHKIEFFTVKEYEDYLQSAEYMVLKNSSNSILHKYSHLESYSEINKNIFENNLLIKNLSLRNQNRIRETITEKGTPEVKEKFQTYLNQKRKLAQLEIENTESSLENYKQLSETNENLEKELIRLSSEFADAQKDLQIDWKDLQKKLKPDEAIVDLVSFNLYTDKWTDSIQYAAFVLTKESEFPKFIPLFEESELRYNLSPSQKDSLYKTPNLYSLVFSALENDLAGKSTLYYSPSGLLHQINLKAVQDESGNKLGDRFNIHLLGSPTELMKLKETYLKPNVSLILYGAIDYDKAEISEKENTSDLESNLSELVTRSGIRGWSYLPGTLKEIQSINEQAKKKGYQSTIIEGRKATKNSFLNWNGKKEPFVLHLATHGFFFENEAKDSVLFTNTTLRSNSFGQTITLSSNPMIRSGILFAGANKSWNKPDTNNEGILTASEIASLDLTQCELVILSACETGLGDINGSEGVFGLQRAFKLAGAKNIIMSLWKIPDEQTAELFEYFYQELFSGKSVHQSLEIAQSKMKEKYDPYFWAGFVLLE